MAACRCGITTKWALTVGGERVQIDAHDSYRGPGRFRVLEYGSTWLVEPIPEDAGVGHFDHRLTCAAISPAERNEVLLALRGDRDAEQFSGRGAPPA